VKEGILFYTPIEGQSWADRAPILGQSYNQLSSEIIWTKSSARKRHADFVLSI
jgi:hypothetical protein